MYGSLALGYMYVGYVIVVFQYGEMGCFPGPLLGPKTTPKPWNYATFNEESQDLGPGISGGPDFGICTFVEPIIALIYGICGTYTGP